MLKSPRYSMSKAIRWKDMQRDSSNYSPQRVTHFLPGPGPSSYFVSDRQDSRRQNSPSHRISTAPRITSLEAHCRQKAQIPGVCSYNIDQSGFGKTSY